MTAFCRMIAADAIPPEGLTLDLEADAETLAALARRFDLRALSRLTAHLQLRREGRDIRITGDFEATLVRECVVTLRDFDDVIAEPLHILYQAELDDADAEGIVVDAESGEDIEPLPEGGIDPGEVVAQSLSLALDPFPRAPGAGAVDPCALSAGSDDVAPSPFAGLEKLRTKT